MIYKYLFYRLYKRQRTKFSEIESSLFAILTITAIIFVNLFTLDIFISKLFLLPSIYKTKSIVIISMTVIFGINCLIFLIKERYKDIELKFIHETKTQQNIGTFSIIAFIILSLILFFVAVNY